MRVIGLGGGRHPRSSLQTAQRRSQPAGAAIEKPGKVQDLTRLMLNFGKLKLLLMPKANLRILPPYLSFQEWECSVCKTKFSFKSHNVRDDNAARALKAVLFKEWDEHLEKEHRRQWDAMQAKKARRQNRSDR